MSKHYVNSLSGLQALIDVDGLEITEPEPEPTPEPKPKPEPKTEPEPKQAFKPAPKPPKDPITGYTLVRTLETKLDFFQVFVKVLDTGLKRGIDTENLKIHVSVACTDYHAVRGYRIYRVHACGTYGGIVADAEKYFDNEPEAKAYFKALVVDIEKAIETDTLIEKMIWRGNMSVTTNREARDAGDPTLAD